MPPLEVAPISAPATPPAAAGGLARDDVRKLHAALHELAECRKLIEAAMLPPV
jgi:hypothetical protein